MNLSAVTHESTLPFRQPLARNIICFRMLAAAGDVSACSLFYWKRSEPYPESRRVLPLAVRYQDGIKAEWVGEAVLPEEAHYLKYFFKLTDAAGASVYYSEHGFSKEEPGRGFFELLQAAETDVRKAPQWARGCVYYQIFPERFAVGNPNKELRGYERWDSEPTRENFLGGDLRGIREKLAYLEELGVECLYLNPVFAADFNHKYATTDYFAVDPDFGTTEDLTALVREAHSRGIRVLLDGVFNHVGVHFAPFLDLKENGERSKHRDWFYPKRFPIELDPGCYECVGDYPYMPRLRVANPEVRAFVLSVLLHWLDTADIDGWRLDVADELDTAAVRFFREEVKKKHPGALLLGETWGDASRMVCEGDQMDSAMNYLFRDAMVDYFARDRIDEVTLDGRLQHMLMKYPDEVNLCMYNCLGSHDTARFLTEAGGETWRLRLATAFQMLFPGSPAVYYGDEIGMRGENDPGCRAGMAWERPDEELLSWTQKLIGLRKANEAIRHGSYRTVACDAKKGLFAFERRLGSRRVLAVFNRGGAPQTLDFADAGETVVVLPRSVKIIEQ